MIDNTEENRIIFLGILTVGLSCLWLYIMLSPKALISIFSIMFSLSILVYIVVGRAIELGGIKNV